MQILRVLVLAGMAATEYQAITQPEVVQVRRVIDGQTIDVASGRIRLAGIRAPRLARGAAEDEPFARAARDRLDGLVTHRFVRLEFPSRGSRASAYVLLEDGTFINALLVSEGIALPSGRPSGTRGDALRAAEDQAKAARRGLWGTRQFPW